MSGGDRRRLGGLLLGFGLVGLVLLAAAAILLAGSVGTISDAAAGFDRERARAVSLLGSTEQAIRDAATSAGNAGASLRETGAAAREGAGLTAQLAASFDQLAALGTLDVLGTRPFAGVAGQFADTATRSRALSAELTAAADAMATNVADSERVAARLGDLAAELGRLRTDLAAGPGASPVGPVLVVLLGLLAWLALAAAASAWLGWRWSHGAPEQETVSR